MINKAKDYLKIGYEQKVKLMDYYNKNCYPYVAPDRKYRIQPNDDWCSMFTTVIAHMMGLSSSQFPYEVSVWYQCEWAKRRGVYFTDITKAKPNDLIIYDWKKGNRYNHVGFIVEVGRLTIKAIEGNKDNTVGYRTVNVNSSSIRGFISIDYETEKIPASPVNDADYIALQALRTVTGRYGNGSDRITALGGDYKAVQALINRM